MHTYNFLFLLFYLEMNAPGAANFPRLSTDRALPLNWTDLLRKFRTAVDFLFFLFFLQYFQQPTKCFSLLTEEENNNETRACQTMPIINLYKYIQRSLIYLTAFFSKYKYLDLAVEFVYFYFKKNEVVKNFINSL